LAICAAILVKASGQIEVIDEHTLLVRLDTDREIEQDDDESLKFLAGIPVWLQPTG
jgi:hypothetical protein